MLKENTILSRGDTVGDKQVQNDNECGRSMVEMLGVLAVMGVLSVGGVAMYTSAMNKHRANELLNEASKRAASVAAQISMNGKDAADTSVAEFTNPSGYTFGVAKKNANQFNITIDAVDTDICTQMKAAAGTNTPIRKINERCTELTFNNDMSTTVWASDYEDSDSCTNAGHDWCGTTASGVCAPTGTDCCTVLSYDNTCQTCTNGVVKNDYNSVCQTCEDGVFTNKEGECTTANNTAGVCEDGYCKPAGATLTDKDCITQAECGGTGSGYFCYYSSYDSSTYCTEDPATAMGCAGAATAAACSSDKKGQCKKVSTYFDKGAKIEGLGYLTKSKKVNNKGLRWWSAVNWCQAQGRSLFNLHSPTENKLQCANKAIGTGLTTGRCCNNANPSCTTDVSQQSTVMQQIRNATTGFGTSGYLWTQNTCTSCHAFRVELNTGAVTGMGRNASTDLWSALCE